MLRTLRFFVNETINIGIQVEDKEPRKEAHLLPFVSEIDWSIQKCKDLKSLLRRHDMGHEKMEIGLLLSDVSESLLVSSVKSTLQELDVNLVSSS